MSGTVLCTSQHRKAMESNGLSDLEVWKECIREASRPRFDKRTGQSIPRGVFIKAVALMKEWDPERFDLMSNERSVGSKGDDDD